MNQLQKIAIAETARLAFEREVIGGLPEVAHKTVSSIGHTQSLISRVYYPVLPASIECL